MQYQEDKKNGNTPLYIIIGVCILAIALVSYLAAVKSNDKMKTEDEKDKSSSNSELSSDTSSYNDSNSMDKKSMDNIFDENTENNAANDSNIVTENTVSDVPYEEEKQSFVMPIKGNIIKGYSDTSLQYDKTYGDLRMHKGIDISCEENAQVVSASKGTVTDISETANYGTIVTIDHGNGLIVKYCGLGSVCITKGETVGAGVLIGTQKNPSCECMDENHIHIECTIDGEDASPVKAFGF